MKQLSLPPTPHLTGTVKLPGSKSMSNRVLLLAALARGNTVVQGLLEAEDTFYMLDALAKLGVTVKRCGPTEGYCIAGVDGHFPVKQADLFLGNAGTALRPLTAVLALTQGHYQLSGVARMHERPIGDLVDALRTIGANIHYLGTPGYPPLRIAPATLTITSPILIGGNVSSQFLTALLMALPLTGEAAQLIVKDNLISKPYIDITLKLMQHFGVTVIQQQWKHFLLPANPHYLSPGNIVIEGDASSASYFLAAGALAGGPVRVEGVGHDSIQGDVQFTQTLTQMGATIRMGANWIEARHVGKLTAVDVDLNHIPDAAMTIAVMALAAQGTTRIRNIGSWRVKETDRLAALAAELTKLGAIVEQGQHFLCITPPPTLRPGIVIDTYGDHRMAMCFSLVSTMNTAVTINDPDCVAKTFPTYFDELARLRTPLSNSVN